MPRIPMTWTSVQCTLVVMLHFCICIQLRNDGVNAVRDYRRAIRLNPNYVLAYYNLANIYFFSRQFRQASNTNGNGDFARSLAR